MGSITIAGASVPCRTDTIPRSAGRDKPRQSGARALPPENVLVLRRLEWIARKAVGIVKSFWIEIDHLQALPAGGLLDPPAVRVTTDHEQRSSSRVEPHPGDDLVISAKRRLFESDAPC